MGNPHLNLNADKSCRGCKYRGHAGIDTLGRSFIICGHDWASWDPVFYGREGCRHWEVRESPQRRGRLGASG